MPALSVYEADGPEEWDYGHWDSSGAGTAGQLQCPLRIMSIFGQLARLMVILNNTPGDRRLSAADKLSEWLDQLPKHCSPKKYSGPFTPPLANLDMMYWAVKAYVTESLPNEPHTMLEDILAQDAGNEPFTSNFMQNLGFFDEDLPLQDNSL
ncbi:hypothetical protein MBLNU13_g09673t1 [Cladosporium sp. NU13]